MKKKCSTVYCRNTPKGNRKECSTCRVKKHRKNDEVKAAFENLKHNSKRRGKPFTITLEYFRKFCRETYYMAGKGRSKTSFTIDCIENDKGYVEGNIRVLPKGENSSKGTKVLNYDWETKYAVVYELPPMREEDKIF